MKISNSFFLLSFFGTDAAISVISYTQNSKVPPLHTEV